MFECTEKLLEQVLPYLIVTSLMDSEHKQYDRA